jgi:two-component system nitrate/nitrite response regulator NarL
LRLLIDSRDDMTVVGDAGNINEGIDLVAKIKPDIVLLELSLLKQTDMNTIRGIKEASDQVRLILLSDEGDSAVIQEAVKNGVMGLVNKKQPPSILFKALEKVNAGEVWLERSLIASILSHLSGNHSSVSMDPEEESISQLSEREKQVIGLIAQGLKNKNISNHLCITENTVRHHLTSIYRKLGVSDRLELLVFAHRYDLVHPPYPPN